MAKSLKNRLHDYEEGWLSLLLSMGVAEKKDLRAAQTRVAQAALDEMNRERGKRRSRRRKRD